MSPRTADFLDLPDRPAKPRETGISHVIDKGLSPRQVEDLFETSGEYIDIVKLGWGTAYVTPNLREKVRRYQSYGVAVVIGGTFWEACLAQGRLAEWKDFIGDLGLRHVEVSDGTVDVPHEQKLACIEEYAADFTVLSEVGSKDGNAVIAPYRWVEMIRGELDAGAWKVITEARESGTAGVFRGDGEVRSRLIDEIAQSVDVDRLLFEAPQKAQQVWFIRAFGPNVNLGNIPPDEVIPLETLRLGLRSDTLRTMPGTGSPDGAAL
jgi:phosphosulfolactate synthase